MEQLYHLLNGDALKEQFPANITGKTIVFRECLVDGPVEAKVESTFFEKRILFLSQHYGAKGREEYNDVFLTELEKLNAIPKASPLFLWFEDDLFCQVNLWYCLHKLYKIGKTSSIFLVRPLTFSPYSFGGLNEKELEQCFKEAIPLTDLTLWKTLWEAYQNNEVKQLTKIAEDLAYPFVQNAVQAHCERLPTKGHLGRPLERLKAIQHVLNTLHFGTIYQEFQRTEAHYGYGDLTVKRLWQELQEKG